MLAIDANIFIEVFLHQEKYEECRSFLEKIKDGILTSCVCDVTISSVAIVLSRHNVDYKTLRSALLAISEMEGLSIITTTLRDKIDAVKYMSTYSLDFEDSITLRAAILSNSGALVSFDADFDRQRLIKRITPSQALQTIKEDSKAD